MTEKGTLCRVDLLVSSIIREHLQQCDEPLKEFATILLTKAFMLCKIDPSIIFQAKCPKAYNT